MVIMLRIGQPAYLQPKAAKSGYGWVSQTERELVESEGDDNPDSA